MSIALTATYLTLGNSKQLFGHDVLDVVTTSTGPSVLVRQQQADGSVALSFADGKGIVELTRVPNIRTSSGGTYSLLAAAVAMNDKRCAVWSPANGNLGFACEGAAAEDSGLKMGTEHRLVVVSTTDGRLKVVGQNDFAAYGVSERSAAGRWSDVPKYLSSITWGEDAVAYGGDAVSCVTSGSGVSLDFHDELSSSTTQTTSSVCRLAVGSAGLHVLNGDYYGVVPIASLGQHNGTFALQQTTAIASNDQLIALILANDKPMAIVAKGGDALTAVPLTGGGAAIPLETKTAQGVHFDPTVNALRWVTSSIDTANAGDTAPESLTVSTRCTTTW